MPEIRLDTAAEAWPIRDRFAISRGAKTVAEVVVARLDDGMGWGECTPYSRYGESVQGVIADINGIREEIESHCDRGRLQKLAPPGAARNAVDCAMWDLEAKRTGIRVSERAGIGTMSSLTTAFTVSLGTPDEMARIAQANAHRSILKLKIGGVDDLDRVAAVRSAAPKSVLIVDANESLNLDDLRRLSVDLHKLGVALIEQPLPANEDSDLEGVDCPIVLCADESLHSRAELAACARRYDCVNIKLDKAGGLTEALALKAAAREMGLQVMVGCMVATSLAMAPAMLVAQGVDWVDLDGPLLLERDRESGLAYEGSTVRPPSPALWG